MQFFDRPYSEWSSTEVLRAAVLMLFSLGTSTDAVRTLGKPIAARYLEATSSGRSPRRLFDRPRSARIQERKAAFLMSTAARLSVPSKAVANEIMRDAVRAFLLATPNENGVPPGEPRGLIARAARGLPFVAVESDPEATDRVITMLRVLLPVMESAGIRVRRGRPSKVEKSILAHPERLEAMLAVSVAPGGVSMLAQVREQEQQRRERQGRRLGNLDREARSVVERYRRLLRKRAQLKDP